MVSYVNTTAAVKAETDICCTSSNAVDVVASIPEDRTVLFGPDQFLGAHVQRSLDRENMHIWLGECHVHAGINGAELKAQVDAELFIHPECGCATSALYLAESGVVPDRRTQILSTSGMVDRARRTGAKRVGAPPRSVPGSAVSSPGCRSRPPRSKPSVVTTPASSSISSTTATGWCWTPSWRG